jgi:hypothetical protein
LRRAPEEPLVTLRAWRIEFGQDQAELGNQGIVLAVAIMASISA